LLEKENGERKGLSEHIPIIKGLIFMLMDSSYDESSKEVVFLFQHVEKSRLSLANLF
jgi:hypothetical protein